MRHWIAVEELDGHQPLVMGSIWVESDIPQMLDAYDAAGRTVHILELEFEWDTVQWPDGGMKFNAGWY